MFQNKIFFAAAERTTSATVFKLFFQITRPDFTDIAMGKTDIRTASQAIDLLRPNISAVHFTPLTGCIFAKFIIITHRSFVRWALVTHYAAISHHLIYFNSPLK
jgi:hypothetical protein